MHRLRGFSRLAKRGGCGHDPAGQAVTGAKAEAAKTKADAAKARAEAARARLLISADETEARKAA